MIEVTYKDKDLGWEPTGADWFLTRRAARQSIADEKLSASDQFDYRVRKYVPEKA